MLSALTRSWLIIVVAVLGFLLYGYILVSRASNPMGPIFGLLSLLLIYRSGLELGLPRGFSLAAGIILAGSPTFIFTSMRSETDPLVMFWSLAAILAALLSRKRDGWATLAGVAFGMAFLTQPSGLLLLIPILFNLRLKLKNILYFILGVLPTVAIFFIYHGAYNHPLMTWLVVSNNQHTVRISGYIERFKFFGYWIKVTMSPLPLIGWLAVAADPKVEWRNRAMLLSWFGGFFLFASFYDIDRVWWNSSLLLPAFPAMILGSLLVAKDLSQSFGKRISEVNKIRLSWIILAILVAVTLSHQKRNIRRFDVFHGASKISLLNVGRSH